MSWQERLRIKIKLESPTGDIYEAFWRKNPVSMEKKLGIFDYPKVKGSIVQDLDVKSPIYSMTIFFEGADNDIESINFFNSCADNGVWLVTHPVLGLLNLQLVSVTQVVDPTDSGNITAFNLDWIQPITDDNSISFPELIAQIENQSDNANTTGSDQFVQNVVQDTNSQVTAIESTTNSIVEFATTRLKPLYETVPELNAQIISIVRGIQDTITQTTIETLSLVGQIQNLIQLPLLASNDIIGRISIYGNLIIDVLGLSPDIATTENKNVISVQELTLTAILVSLSQITTSGTLNTRSEALQMIDVISDDFINITDGLDEVQQLYINNDIDLQYFSQSNSFPDVSVIIAQAQAYLLLSSFDLYIEKRFILEKPRVPIEIAITEYGNLGVDDSNLDLFIQSNKLKNNDILLLPAGREVVVYV